MTGRIDHSGRFRLHPTEIDHGRAHGPATCPRSSLSVLSSEGRPAQTRPLDVDIDDGVYSYRSDMRLAASSRSGHEGVRLVDFWRAFDTYLLEDRHQYLAKPTKRLLGRPDVYNG
jgi:hypothetical protein